MDVLSSCCGYAAVGPTPATHAILAQLKEGNAVYQVGELLEAFRVSTIRYELLEYLKHSEDLCVSIRLFLH